ncbi:MarR family winged helix-turn-helix transcriptional regulator [Compostimonas suwonensis]|uniref:DNA-binding MarR family transcriptional regulator n=1 Tax=Compostimonas suwonensis TaxID=1048394 RepID=A0A2M9C0E5_9MICO|nr:MarR family transcriptional regulator [Compostimonas suwonensis]PJJ63794.1 DNA-binding MarR family transcriptional regulator [Compostimonas suwonensis]
MSNSDVESDAGPRRPRFESGLGFLLSRVGSIVDAAWGEVLAAHGLSNAQYNVLAVLAEFGTMTQGELAKRVAVDPRNIGKTVAALAERGVVSAEPIRTDGRAKAVTITDAGLAVLDTFVTALPPYRGKLTRALSATEEAELTRLLRKLYADYI